MLLTADPTTARASSSFLPLEDVMPGAEVGRRSLPEELLEQRVFVPRDKGQELPNGLARRFSNAGPRVRQVPHECIAQPCRCISLTGASDSCLQKTVGLAPHRSVPAARQLQERWQHRLEEPRQLCTDSLNVLDKLSNRRHRPPAHGMVNREKATGGGILGGRFDGQCLCKLLASGLGVPLCVAWQGGAHAPPVASVAPPPSTDELEQQQQLLDRWERHRHPLFQGRLLSVPPACPVDLLADD
mmetsp:Transcript_40994/g.97394  ORF Transcript_40994/g.97394 Transcript_40994/m.97394 type:complete len:243 (+) Transcript_40994:203-931(+)